MNCAFPDVVVTEEDLIAVDGKVVERSSAVGTHRGDSMGIAPHRQARLVERDSHPSLNRRQDHRSGGGEL
jgi:hypothetical protein